MNMATAPSDESFDSRSPSVLSLDDLRVCTLADIERDNDDLSEVRRGVYEWAGSRYQLARAVEPVEAALWLTLDVAGQAVVVGLSDALASVLLQQDQLGWNDLSPGVLSLWVHRRLSGRWPANMSLVAAALHRRDLNVGREISLQSEWRAQSMAPAPSSGLAVSIWSERPCPSAWLLQALSSWWVGRKPSALGHISLPVPLVAARWTVDALDLVDLAVGDVLLLN